jgi:DNA-binding NtrC family response regulator
MEQGFQMVGSSRTLEQARELIGRVAPTPAVVLITGESGSGKETVARAIHLQSLRATGPFVALNCDAISSEQTEAELFGQDRGVPTGTAGRKGKLLEADKGTLFLDEVANLSLAAQARLLRFLEHPEMERLGSGESLSLDVRVLAATSKNLAARIKGGSFREDLYHHLNVVTIRVPALRERPDDVEELTAFFLDRFCRQYNREVTLSPECQSILRGHDWPGNVRELRNLVERVVVLARADSVDPDELRSFLGVDSPSEPVGTFRTGLERAEREQAVRAMAVRQRWTGTATHAHGHHRHHRHRHRHRTKSRLWWERNGRRLVVAVVIGLVFVAALSLMLVKRHR